MSSFCVGKAKSNRSSCKGCRVNIDKNELRMGVINDHSDYGTTTKWYHLECFHTKVRNQPQNQHSIRGFSTLTSHLKSKVLSIIFDEEPESESTTEESENDSESETVESESDSNSFSSEDSTEEDSDIISNSNRRRRSKRIRKRSRAMKNKMKSRKRKKPDSDFSSTADESESDSNKNKKQKKKKKKKVRNDNLSQPVTKRARLMSTINDNIPQMKVSELKQYLKKYDLPASGRKLDLQQRLSKFVNEPQKTKVEFALLKKQITKDKIEWRTVYESLEVLTVAELKEKLKSNGMKRTGNKSVLVERITECRMWGCFPRCPECGTATLNVRYPQRFGHHGQGKWQCPGYFDDEDYVRCGFRSCEEIERRPWND